MARTLQQDLNDATRRALMLKTFATRTIPFLSRHDYHVEANSVYLLTVPDALIETGLIASLMNNPDFKIRNFGADTGRHAGTFYAQATAKRAIEGPRGRPKSVSELFGENVKADVVSVAKAIPSLKNTLLIIGGVLVAGFLVFAGSAGAKFKLPKLKGKK